MATIDERITLESDFGPITYTPTFLERVADDLAESFGVELETRVLVSDVLSTTIVKTFNLGGSNILYERYNAEGAEDQTGARLGPPYRENLVASEGKNCLSIHNRSYYPSEQVKKEVHKSLLRMGKTELAEKYEPE